MLRVHYILQNRGCLYTFKVHIKLIKIKCSFNHDYPSVFILLGASQLIRTTSYQCKPTCYNIHSNREITGEPMARKSNSGDQLCPKARRLVATSGEIKALGMRRYRVPANPRPACHWPSWNPDTNIHGDSWIWSDKHQKTQEEREHAKWELT